MGHKVKYGKLHLSGRKNLLFYFKARQTLEKMPREAVELSSLGYVKTQADMVLKQPVLSTQTDLETPESPVSPWDSVTKMCRTECRCTEGKMRSRIRINENTDLIMQGGG